MKQTIDNSEIYTIDALYIKPHVASIHLIVSHQRVAIVDTGTQHSINQIKQALTQLSLNWSHVDYIILTHIHLDHAGGASALMKLCHHAKLVCHPKGARHMIQPERLVNSTKSVYGAKKFEQLYGDITPISADRIVQPDDDDTIQLAGRVLRFINTPGHANHHFCIIDKQTNSVFTGDTLGISYPSLHSHDIPFLFPATTPTQFDPTALHNSITRVMSHQPDTLYLTHYGAITPTALLIASLHEQIDDLVMLTQQVIDMDSVDQEHELTQRVANYFQQRCANLGCLLAPQAVAKQLTMDSQLNAQGLLFWANNK